jgi:hypothetical protein
MSARASSARSRGPRLPAPRLPALPSPRRVMRWTIAALFLGLALGAGYLFWLRDSSLVAIEQVNITGAEGRPEVVGALVGAAEDMTTLHVDEAALEAAVAEDPSVLSVSAEADFPNGLTIAVDSREPAAFVEDGGLVVAGDGVVLEAGVERPEDLAAIEADGAAGAEPGTRLEGGGLALARIMAGAPEELVPHVTGARIDADRGPVAIVGPGIELRFRDPSRADAKWAAAVAVLADPATESAVYIDLAVPSRPAIG